MLARSRADPRYPGARAPTRVHTGFYFLLQQDIVALYIGIGFWPAMLRLHVARRRASPHNRIRPQRTSHVAALPPNALPTQWSSLNIGSSKELKVGQKWTVPAARSCPATAPKCSPHSIY
jgi:hypothetical protein